MKPTEEVTSSLLGAGKYLGRLGLETALVYGFTRTMVGADHEYSFNAAATYGIIRNAIDGFDALILNQGRLHDFLSSKPNRSENSVKEPV